jgi:hypothetical protein
MAKLGLPIGEIPLEFPEDPFTFLSVFPIRVDLSAGVVERLDSGCRPKVFKEFPKQVKSIPVPPKIHACNLFVQESLPHAIHSEALVEVDEIIDQLATGQEGNGMVVITVRFVLVFVDPVEDCTDGWVSVLWDDCPLSFIKVGDGFFFCYSSKLCCRESRYSD